MADSLERRMKKIFSEESKQVVDVVNNFKDKKNIIYDFGDEEKDSEEFAKTKKKKRIVFNRHNLGSHIFADNSNKDYRNFNKLKNELIENITHNKINLNLEDEKRVSNLDREMDPKKAEYLKTIRYMEKALEIRKSKHKPEFHTFMKVDDFDTRMMKKNRSQERLQEFKKRFVIPNRESILLPSLEDDSSFKKRENNLNDVEYFYDDNTNEIIVKNIKLSKTSSMDFDINVNYDRFSADKNKIKHKSYYDKNSKAFIDYKKGNFRITNISKQVIISGPKTNSFRYMNPIKNSNRRSSVQYEVNERETIYNVDKGTGLKLNIVKTPINFGKKQSSSNSKDKNIFQKMSFPTYEERNNIKILNFLNDKFEFYKGNNHKINLLSQEFINTVNKSDFPVKSIYYIEELEKEKKKIGNIVIDCIIN